MRSPRSNVSTQVATVITPIVFWQLYVQLGVASSFGVTAVICLLGAGLTITHNAPGKPEVTSGIAPGIVEAGSRFRVAAPAAAGLYLLDVGVTVVSFYRQLSRCSPTSFSGLGPPAPGS